MDQAGESQMERTFDEQKWPDAEKGSKGILNILISSKEDGTSVGISSPAFGEGFVITAVEDIILQDGETLITFKPFDVTGFMLPSATVKLGEI